MKKAVMAFLAAGILAISPAYGTESRNLIRIPTTAVLPAWGIGVEVAGRSFLHGKYTAAIIDKAGKAASQPETVLNIGLNGKTEAGIRWNSGSAGFKAVSVDVRNRLLDEKGMTPSVAIGMMGITSSKFPFPESFAPADGENQAVNNPENNSWFLVAGKKIPFLGDTYFGVGGGRFVGHGQNTKMLHGLFGGVRKTLVGSWWGGMEMDGRNINGGTGVGIEVMDGLSVNALLKGEFFENIRKSSRMVGLRPAIGGTIELVYTPVFGSVKREKKFAPKSTLKTADKIEPKQIEKQKTVTSQPAMRKSKKVVKEDDAIKPSSALPKAPPAPAIAPIVAPVVTPGAGIKAPQRCSVCGGIHGPEFNGRCPNQKSY